MGSLLLIRHGQASFFDPNYDQLSEVGEEQSRCLGRFWATLDLPLDAVYLGPKQRHRQTADQARTLAASGAVIWPESRLLEGVDELQAGKILKHTETTLRHQDPEVGTLAEGYLAAESRKEKLRHFQFLFEKVIGRWVDNALDDPSIETWDTFAERVQHSVEEVVREAGRGKRVAIFTSMGPIVAMLAGWLKLDGHAAFELGWRIRNASITEFVFTEGRRTLDTFNAIPHLTRRDLWTYR